MVAVWAALLTRLGLEGYQRSGLDPLYLGLLGLLNLYFGIGIIVSILETSRVLIFLGGMLLLVRLWSNRRHGRTDGFLLKHILALTGEGAVSNSTSGLKAFHRANTVKGEIGLFLRGPATQEIPESAIAREMESKN